MVEPTVDRKLTNPGFQAVGLAQDSKVTTANNSWIMNLQIQKMKDIPKVVAGSPIILLFTSWWFLQDDRWFVGDRIIPKKRWQIPRGFHFIFFNLFITWDLLLVIPEFLVYGIPQWLLQEFWIPCPLLEYHTGIHPSLGLNTRFKRQCPRDSPWDSWYC